MAHPLPPPSRTNMTRRKNPALTTLAAIAVAIVPFGGALAIGAAEAEKDAKVSLPVGSVKTDDHDKLTGPAAEGEKGKPEIEFRLREGTRLVDQLGHFRMTGDRVAFFTEDGKGRFTGLENLNLQRVAAAIGEQPGKRLWKVTGTITEFRGENYLLLDRVNLESWEKHQAEMP